MTNTLLLDIVNFLIAGNIVTADGEDIFRDFTPESPDELTALHEYAGDHALSYDSGVHRSVQITCRNKDADAARQKALSIFELFRNSQSTDNKVHIPSRAR